MLEFSEVVLGYSRPLGDLQVTAPLTFSVRPRHIVGVIGPSGVGKSTILKAAAGLLESTEGRIVTSAEQVPGGPWYLAQSPVLLPFRNVLENALFGRETQKRLTPADVALGKELLTKLSLIHASTSVPAEISGGMKRRLALAQAILSNRNLLLLDEPLAELDFETRLKCEATISNISRLEIGCLVASHDIDSIVAMADEVIVLKGPLPARAIFYDLGSGALGMKGNPQERRATKAFVKVVADLQRELWLPWT